MVWPFFAAGGAFLLSWVRQQMLTRPTHVIVSLLTIPVLWNVGLVRLYDGGELRSSAPVHEVFAGQATQLRRLVHAALFAVPEPDRSALVYRIFFSRYAYRNLQVSNLFDLANIPERMLAGGWSAVVTDEGGRTYRRAEAAGACLRVPLERPADLVGTWRLRSSNRAENQVAASAFISSDQPVCGRCGQYEPLYRDRASPPLALPDLSKPHTGQAPKFLLQGAGDPARICLRAAQ